MCKERELKVGDRVVVKYDWIYSFLEGKTGRIVCIDGDGDVCVEFDKHDPRLHSCGGNGKKNHCYYVMMEDLELIEDCPKYEVGDVVKIKKWDDMVKEFGTTPGLFTGEPNIESEIAFSFGMKRFCDKEFKIERKFDLAGTTVYELEGCKPLALALPYAFSADTFVGKVTAEEKPKLYNGKIVCVETLFSDLFTVGKIYEVKDGYFTNNRGCKNLRALFDFEDIKNTFASSFIEVIE